MASRSLLLIPAILFSTTLAAADANSITLGQKAPPVGSKYTDERASDLQMVVNAGGKTLQIATTEKMKKKVEVLEIKDNVITKAKITYEQDQKSKKQGDKSDGGSSAIEGKTYTVTAGAGGVDVAAASGKAPDAELALVKDREKRFGKPDKMSKVLAGKKFEIGKAVELSGPEVADAFADDPNLELKKLTLTYRGMDGKNAKFDMSMQMASAKGGMDMKFDLNGKALIEPVTGEPAELKLEGTVKSTGKAGVDGKLSITGRRTR